jgi:SAM-dependent methyltransferase
MIFPPPPRCLRAELLDLDQAPFEEVCDSLRDVERVNRYLSGYRVLLEHVGGFLARHAGPAPFTLLDVATGSADQPVEVVKLARRMNVPIRVTAIDINAKMLRFARERTRAFPEIRFVRCDIFSLPFAPGSFDLVTNSLSLHHFERQGVVDILRTLAALGRQGFVVNDLHRSRVAFAAIWLLTRLLTQNRLTRYDAPVSVMNAFTPQEFQTMAREAGIDGARVIRHFPYRIAVVGTSLPQAAR